MLSMYSTQPSKITMFEIQAKINRHKRKLGNITYNEEGKSLKLNDTDYRFNR